jgi:hypothetical protein
MENLQWIAKGNTGCTFATLFAKNPKLVGWETITPYEWATKTYNKDAMILSIEFSAEANINQVKQWALSNGFFIENTSDNTEGLRIDCPEGVSWVQYFGLDSHVSTRRTPYPMLMFTRKLNASYYAKVGFKGVLHLAHAFTNTITEKAYDLLWNRSYSQTRKKLGFSPTINEASKTTWLK